jgi:hypothetical protein
VSGMIVLTYDLYYLDPSIDPSAVEIAGGNYVTADASVTTVPEPAPLLQLLSSGLAVAVLLRRKHVSSRTAR